MKNLIIINGASCIGKTAVCQKLFKFDGSCAYLDADWTRYIHPYTTMTPEIREKRTEIISHILRSYIQNEEVDNIYFSWIMPDRDNRCSILEKLSDLKFIPHFFLLVCNKKEHKKRMSGRDKDEQAQKYILDFAKKMQIDDQIVIDVSQLTADKAAKEITKHMLLQKTTNE